MMEFNIMLFYVFLNCVIFGEWSRSGMRRNALSGSADSWNTVVGPLMFIFRKAPFIAVANCLPFVAN